MARGSAAPACAGDGRRLGEAASSRPRPRPALIVAEVPLLFETGMSGVFDYVMLITAPDDAAPPAPRGQAHRERVRAPPRAADARGREGRAQRLRLRQHRRAQGAAATSCGSRGPHPGRAREAAEGEAASRRGEARSSCSAWRWPRWLGVVGVVRWVGSGASPAPRSRPGYATPRLSARLRRRHPRRRRGATTSTPRSWRPSSTPRATSTACAVSDAGRRGPHAGAARRTAARSLTRPAA